MRVLAATLMLAALIAGPALAGSPGSSSIGGDGATAPSRVFPSDDPSAGRIGTGTSASCVGVSSSGGPCLSAGSVGQVTAPLPPGLIVTGTPTPAPAPSGQ